MSHPGYVHFAVQAGGASNVCLRLDQNKSMALVLEVLTLTARMGALRHIYAQETILC
jgi:hypothetical protein